MKTCLLVLAAAALSGCAVYPATPYESYDSTVLLPYGVVQPAYIYGGGYRYGDYRAYPRGYNRVHPGAFPHRPPRPHLQAPHPGHGARDSIRKRLPHRR